MKGHWMKKEQKTLFHLLADDPHISDDRRWAVRCWLKDQKIGRAVPLEIEAMGTVSARIEGVMFIDEAPDSKASQMIQSFVDPRMESRRVVLLKEKK
jgi:hypothetical protein